MAIERGSLWGFKVPSTATSRLSPHRTAWRLPYACLMISLLASLHHTVAAANRMTMPADPNNGELAARATPTPKLAAPVYGLSKLADRPRATLVYVPSGYRADLPSAAALILHGAGEHPHQVIRRFIKQADERGIILIAPGSRAYTWDIVVGGTRYGRVQTAPRFGPDVRQIDAALGHVFANYNIDPSRVAVIGFSDGASYALSLGINNGAIFRRIIAFSPGFVAPTRGQGKPKILVTHGSVDKVLPPISASRKFVPLLKAGGFDVEYLEFDGGHEIPAKIETKAFDWYLGEAGVRISQP